MKNLFVLICMTTGIFSLAQNNVIYPKTIFDKDLAQSMLAFGTSTITGVASTKQKNTYGLNAQANAKHYAPKGTVVTLFPFTPYFEEFYKLRRAKESRKNAIYLSEEAFKYRIETTTDENGRFRFDKIKPGKYYIECMVSFDAVGANVEQTGTSTTYNVYGQALSTSPIYNKFFYNYNTSNRENKIVVIKDDGQVLDIKL